MGGLIYSEGEGGRGKRFAGGAGVNSGNCAHLQCTRFCSSTCAWVGDIAKKELGIYGEGNLMGEGFKLRIARIRFGQRCLPAWFMLCFWPVWKSFCRQIKLNWNLERLPDNNTITKLCQIENAVLSQAWSFHRLHTLLTSTDVTKRWQISSFEIKLVVLYYIFDYVFPSNTWQVRLKAKSNGGRNPNARFQPNRRRNACQTKRCNRKWIGCK